MVKYVSHIYGYKMSKLVYIQYRLWRNSKITSLYTLHVAAEVTFVALSTKCMFKYNNGAKNRFGTVLVIYLSLQG